MKCNRGRHRITTILDVIAFSPIFVQFDNTQLRYNPDNCKLMFSSCFDTVGITCRALLHVITVGFTSAVHRSHTSLTLALWLSVTVTVCDCVCDCDCLCLCPLVSVSAAQWPRPRAIYIARFHSRCHFCGGRLFIRFGYTIDSDFWVFLPKKRILSEIMWCTNYKYNFI